MMGVDLLRSNPINSIGRNGLDRRDIDSQSEGCEFKSGKLLDIFSNAKLLTTVSF